MSSSVVERSWLSVTCSSTCFSFVHGRSSAIVSNTSSRLADLIASGVIGGRPRCHLEHLVAIMAATCMSRPECRAPS